MSKWKTVRLGDVFELQMGKTPDRKRLDYFKGSHKWISIADISKSEKYISETKESLTDDAISSSGIKIIPKDTVIMSFKLTIGKTAITSNEMYSNEAIMAFLPNKKYETDNSFLYHLFSNKNWSEGSNKAVKGITLNKASLSEMTILLPPLETQKQIAAVLDKCTSLISKYKQILKKYDTLIKSRFIEMFGDPVTNEKGWAMRTLPELGDFGRGVSKHRPRNAPELLGGKYPLIQTGDVANSNLYITEYSSTYSEIGYNQSKMWKAGTLCITIAATIAKTAILTFDSCFPDSVVGFTPNEKTNVLFINYWFSFFQRILEEQAPAVAQKNINLQILSELNIINPPLLLQNQFAAFVQQIDKSKFVVQKSLEKAETLYKSLMQEYFG